MSRAAGRTRGSALTAWLLPAVLLPGALSLALASSGPPLRRGRDPKTAVRSAPEMRRTPASQIGRAVPPLSPVGPAGPQTATRLEGDRRLDRRVTLRASQRRIGTVLETLSGAELSLTAAPSVAWRRISCFASSVSIRDLMAAIADVTRLSWRPCGV